MFIIIPFVIIFLLYAYLKFNDLSSFGEIVVYLLMLAVIFLSYVIAKTVKKDFRQQQINSIQREIYTLEKKISQVDETTQEHYKKEILLLQKDLKNLEDT